MKGAADCPDMPVIPLPSIRLDKLHKTPDVALISGLPKHAVSPGIEAFVKVQARNCSRIASAPPCIDHGLAIMIKHADYVVSQAAALSLLRYFWGSFGRQDDVGPPGRRAGELLRLNHAAPPFLLPLGWGSALALNA